MNFCFSLTNKWLFFLFFSFTWVQAGYIKMPSRLDVEMQVKKFHVSQLWKEKMLHILLAATSTSLPPHTILDILIRLKSELLAPPRSNQLADLRIYTINHDALNNIELDLIKLLLKNANIADHIAFYHYYNLAHKQTKI